MATTQLDSILDLNTLEQYISAIGAGTLLKSVVLFEQLMPEYVSSLVKAGEEAKWEAEHKVWLAEIVEHAAQDLQQLKVYLEAKA